MGVLGFYKAEAEVRFLYPLPKSIPSPMCNVGIRSTLDWGKYQVLRDSGINPCHRPDGNGVVQVEYLGDYDVDSSSNW